MITEWQRLFPEADYRFQISLRPGNTEVFWRYDEATALSLRRDLVAENADRYVRALPEGDAMLEESLAFLEKFATPARDAFSSATIPERCKQMAARLESDWVVLSPDAERGFPIVGGVVAFPSSWALEDKIGRPMHEVHNPAPGLNATLGRSIGTFLEKLAPNVCWKRENWGLSADDVLNHHPAIPRHPLNASATLDHTWLRLERQSLMRLPLTRAILFGIRVSNHRLDHLVKTPGLAPRLARALETMPEDIARYKGLSTSRASLIAALRR
jgi:dimethylamine monooxygenase subunit A